MSKSKVRVTILMLIATMAISALASSAAQAAGGSWFVNGTKLPAGSKQALATTARVVTNAVLNVPVLGIKISCANLSGKSPEIIGTTTGEAEALTFEGCTELSPAKCSIAPTIGTEPIQGDPFIPTKGVTRVAFTPQKGKTFANINFKGAECSVAGEKAVKGAVNVNAPTAQTEQAEQPIEGLGSVENNALEVTSDPAYIEGGKAFLKLSNGDGWSFQE
jgi:hypothetical protein